MIDEEAPLVDHLGELRHRVFVSLFAFVPAFALAFAFHARLIGWLKVPLPAVKQLVTLGVTEPFTTAVKVSVIAAVAIVLPVLLWQSWSFLAPALDRKIQRSIPASLTFSTSIRGEQACPSLA